jgi:hypothetical protein
MSVGIGYLGQWWKTGESREVGVAVNMNGGKVCFYTQVCKTDAIGFCGQVGINVGVQGGLLSSGSSHQKGGFVAGGVGWGANLQVATDDSGHVAGIKGIPRPAPTIGGAIGFIDCKIEYTCWP